MTEYIESKKPIILVRHGQSESNNDPMVGGWQNPGLTSLGQEQAKAVALRLSNELRGKEFVVYSSHLRRAHETAKAICNELGVEPIVDEMLQEYQTHLDPGLSRPEAEQFKLVETTPAKNWRTFTGAESIGELYLRAGKVLSRISDQLKNNINSEYRRKKELASIELINNKTEEFTNKLVEKNDFLKMISVRNDQIAIINDILTTMKEVIRESDDSEFFFIDDFSEKNLNQLLYWVEQTNKVIPKEVEHLSNTFEKEYETRIYYENLIRKVPDNSILAPIISEINKQYSDRGSYETIKTQIEETIAELKIQETEYVRLYDIQLEKYEQQNKHHRKIKVLRKIRTMLNEYQEKIREGKIDMLRTAFLDAISMIIRKHDFINDIIIDSKYNIQLQREDGHYIYKSMLSNGEKQIYAISMLLALAQVSGKPLPFIIDTPLARLDSDHRENIVGTWYYSTEAKSRVLYRSKGITKFTCGFRVRSELGILCRWE